MYQRWHTNKNVIISLNNLCAGGNSFINSKKKLKQHTGIKILNYFNLVYREQEQTKHKCLYFNIKVKLNVNTLLMYFLKAILKRICINLLQHLMY